MKFYYSSDSSYNRDLQLSLRIIPAATGIQMYQLIGQILLFLFLLNANLRKKNSHGRQ